jgi:hypothetical protein
MDPQLGENKQENKNPSTKQHTHTQPRKPRAPHAHHPPGDLGPGHSLDLSLYPLLQASWAYRTLSQTGRRDPVVLEKV